MWLLSILISVIVIIVIQLVNWYSLMRKYSKLENVPGPKPWPFFGNSILVKNTSAGLLKSFLELGKEYGTFYKLWLGPNLHVMVSKLEYLEELLSSNVHLAKSDGYDLFRPWLGDGLLVSTGLKWKGRRKMITPTFHFKVLEEFTKVFNKQFNITLKLLSDAVKSNPDSSLDVHKYVNMASLDIICETAFGTSIDAQHNGNVRYIRAVTSMLEIITRRFFSGWLRNETIFRFSSLYKIYNENLKILHDFTDKIIRERKQEMMKTREKGKENSSDVGIKRKAALLDMLLEATCDGDQLSNYDIREEVDTFMFEGFDTASVAIGYALYSICQNTEIQTKAYHELTEILGTDSQSEITLSQINDLKYLDIIVKEALRYYSPVPLIERMLEEDWTIDGITVPKGSSISIFIYGMNHNPEVFFEPHKFNPERFLPENQVLRHTYSFVPFSAGPRNCIGQKFALYELKVCVAKILLHFELIPDPDFKPDIGMASVLKSRNGIRMKLKLRNVN